MGDTTRKEKVIGKIFFKVQLENTSAMALSNGQDRYSDADIFRDHERRPMIPATSFIGALKSHIKKNYLEQLDGNAFHYLFGYEDKKNNGLNGLQSHLIIDDLVCISEYETTIRDGVKINPRTNLAEDKGKYDYEILEPGSAFELNGEITVRGLAKEEEVVKLLQCIQHILIHDTFQVGSLTSFGFGQLKAEKEFDYTGLLKGSDLFEQLKESNKCVNVLDKSSFETKAPISFRFELVPTTPLFIGGGVSENANADDASLKSNKEYILSAKSLKGAIRHHAFRIANKVHNETLAKVICNDLFGNRADDKKEKLTKSKFWTSDAVIKDPQKDRKAQMQVAIDRFTGGAIESALFSTEPMWPTDDTRVNVEWRLTEDKNHHIGLILLVARDLMTEMLPIGGDKAIGRGRFDAIEAKLIIDNQEINIKPNRAWNDEDLKIVNDYVSSFITYNS